MTTRRPVGLLLGAAILGGAGCTQSFTPPEGYVKVRKPQMYDVKAVSPRGHVIALRSYPNEDRTADVKFWSQAVEYQKVDLDGMKLVSRDAIRSAGGLDGTLFHFQQGDGRSTISYLLALYVTPSKIHTIQATGPAEAIKDEMDAIRKAMESLQ